MTTAISEILADVHWFPEGLDAQNQALSFVHTDRETIASRAFLSQSLWADEALPRRRLGIETVANTISAAAVPPRVNFIWHTAYCCSTLISQALDMPGRNFSVREPDALTVLARSKRGTNGVRNADTRRHLGALLALLARPFVEGEQVTIKPANAANGLIRDVAVLTSGKMLFLYSDCRSFLISVARRGETRRAFVRRLFAEILGDGHEQKNWPMARLFELSDLEIAALAWHMQIAEFQRSRSLLGNRAASLDCDAFLAQPATALAKLAAFFGFTFDQAHIEQVVRGPLLRQNAKSPGEKLGWIRRREEQRALPAQLAKDIESIVTWSYGVCKTTPHGMPLPDPLVESAKTYAH